jgi:hypothetical protein
MADPKFGTPEYSRGVIHDSKTPNLDYRPLGEGKLYDEKYRSTSNQYPDDLFSNNAQYGGNWIAFYINVSSGSKLIKSNLVQTTSNDTPSMRNASVNGTDKAGVLSTIAGQAALGGGAGSILSSGISALGAGLGAGAAAAVALEGRQEQKRITDTIALHVPNAITTSYRMTYSESDTAMQAGAANVSEDVGGALASLIGMGSGSVSQGASTVGSSISAASLGAPGGDLLSKNSGLQANPKKEQIFKAVEFRTFNFEYIFAPRSKKEAQSVAAIIKLFKLHMHPEFKDNKGFLFIYPSEFDIVYYNGNNENMNLPRYTSCILTDCSIGYTPNQNFSSFADGSATQINMTLTFKELAILTKDQILDGF